jgi:hypothetical protein
MATDLLRQNSSPFQTKWLSPVTYAGVALFTAVLFSALSITDQSFWIDEAVGGVHARNNSIFIIFHEMARTPGADLQIPFYNIWEWSWGQIFGTSEVALRAANIPWLIILFCCPLIFFRHFPAFTWVYLPILALNPVLWSSADEAKAYSMFLSGAGILFSCLLRQSGDRKTLWCMPLWWQCIFAFSLVLLSGTHLLGVPWMAAGVIASLTLAPLQRPEHYFVTASIVLTTGLALAVLGVFYLWTLLLGAAPTPAGTGVGLNLAFTTYELFGFLGVGPDKLAVRQEGVSVLFSYLPQILLYGVPVALVTGIGLVRFWGKITKRQTVALLLLTGIPTLFVIGLGTFADFRFLARHLIPWTLLVASLWSVAINHLFSKGRFYNVGLALCFLATQAWSSAEIRLNPRFAKDDYRGAAAMAKSALQEGKVVWWAANHHGANYYGVFPVHADEEGGAFFVHSEDADYLGRLPAPSLVLLSKQDIYDSHGVLRAYFVKHAFAPSRTFPAFIAWEPVEQASDLTQEQ